MENKDLTVVIVNDFDYVQGGASKVALDTANLLYKNGVNVILFTASSNSNNYPFTHISTFQKEFLSEGVKGAFRGIYNRKVKREFSKLLDTLDKKNTIIHFHGWTKSLSSIVFKVAANRKYHSVLTLHDYFISCPNGGFYNYKKNKICDIKPMSLKCIFCNCDSRNYYYKIYRVIRQHFQNRNIKNIKNYIAISNFSYNILAKYIKKDSSIYKISNPVVNNEFEFPKVCWKNNNNYLYVGRVSVEKGTKIFCQALSDMNLPGVVVGDGPQLNYLKSKYPKISFVGWKNHAEVFDYFKISKALIFPSLWYETFGLTVLEAQKSNLPCIVNKNCASSEFIYNGKNGFSYSDIFELKEKIKLLEEDVNIYINSENLTEFDGDFYTEKLLHVYNKIIHCKNK